MSVNYNWLAEAIEALKFILHAVLRRLHIALANLTQPPEISNDGNWNYGCLCLEEIIATIGPKEIVETFCYS